jgi:hypothetical protein
MNPHHPPQGQPRRRNAIILIAACALSVRATAVFSQNSGGFDANYAAWDALLKKHVRWLPDQHQSRVDYRGLTADRAELKKVLDSWSAVPLAAFNSWSRDAQMAFLINAYNGFTIELILTKYPNLKSIKDLGSLLQSAWKKKFFTLLGEARNLDWIEHEQLRPRYTDPRVHTAMVCASIGCPALRPEAYTRAKLEAQLEDGMVRFMADRTRNRYADGQLQVSAIFKWFREDFEKPGSGGRGSTAFKQVEDVFAKYADLLADAPADREKIRTKHVAVTHLDYDWSLNDLAR